MKKIILSLREENHFIKQNYEMQKITINNLSKEKQKLLNDLQELKNVNNNLLKDKDILLEQIKDLNNIINNDISPKLQKNENDFKFLQNKINELQTIIISLKNEKMRILDDNNNKAEMIKVLTIQNKKLLNEIKLKYNKDLFFIESIEKIGIDKNINNDIYKEMINKYDDNKNKNINYSYDKEAKSDMIKTKQRNKNNSLEKKKKKFNKTTEN